MFDQLVTDEEMEAARVTSDSLTVAGLLAALYADPEHPQAALLALVPTLQGLRAALELALQSADLDSACALATEIARICGDQNEANRGALFGSKAGLWRLH